MFKSDLIFKFIYNKNMEKSLKIFGYTILTLGAISMVLPFLYMLSLSFMTEEQIFKSFGIIPSPFVSDGWAHVFKNSDILRCFFNSFFVATLTTIGQVLISAMAGFAFARLKFRFKEPLFVLILLSMMIPPQVNIIPLFFVMKQLHWINTYQALIIPGLFGGFGVFLMRQWFQSFPSELENSAKMDGCSIWQIFVRIALPLATPALITLGIFTFITTWNSFMWPLIVTSSETIKTLPVALAEFKGSFRETTQWAQLMAYSAVCTLPAICVFLLGRKFFINDLLSGSLKE